MRGRREVGRPHARDRRPARAPGGSAPCAPRPSATPRAVDRRTTKALEVDGADRGCPSTRSPRRASSLSWRLTAPLRRRFRSRPTAMIAFGILHRRRRARTCAYARPGIQAAAEPGATVFAFAAVGHVCRSNNLLLDAAGRARGPGGARARPPARGDRRPRASAPASRQAFADPDVAVVGCMGATGVRTIAWWEGRVSRGAVRQRYHEHGGGELAASAGRRSTRRRRRSTPSTAGCWRSRRGRCARCASTRR